VATRRTQIPVYIRAGRLTGLPIFLEDVMPKDTMEAFFLVCVRFEEPQPTDENAPIGWLPVFKTAEAARAYSPKGAIGEITLNLTDRIRHAN
jgi:hypothetical protein